MSTKTKKPEVITKTIFSVQECNANPENLYIFGDNTEGVGLGGQAIIRNCVNASGICTKKSVRDYMTDSEFARNISRIDEDIDTILSKFREQGYKRIVFPSAGLGWGRAKMQVLAPKTAIYLCEVLLREFNFNNLGDLVNRNQY